LTSLSQNYEHESLISDILIWSSSQKHIFLYKRLVGLFRVRGTKLRVGVKGQCDLYGWIKLDQSPIHLEIEVKTGKAVLNPDQKAWKKFCESQKVCYVIARSLEDVKKALSRKSIK